MKFTSVAVLAFMFSALLSFADVEIGKPVPEFEGKDVTGKVHKLSDYKGKIVVLESINLDCPFSLHHYKTGAMQELQAEAAKQGVVWLLINSVDRRRSSYRSPDAAKKEWKQHNIKATAWIDDSDGKIGRSLGMKTTPHMFVINKDGAVAYAGAIDDNDDGATDPRKAKNYVREAIKSLEAGEKLAVTQTKPYGCGIKYAK